MTVRRVDGIILSRRPQFVSSLPSNGRCCRASHAYFLMNSPTGMQPVYKCRDVDPVGEDAGNPDD